MTTPLQRALVAFARKTGDKNRTKIGDVLPGWPRAQVHKALIEMQHHGELVLYHDDSSSSRKGSEELRLNDDPSVRPRHLSRLPLSAGGREVSPAPRRRPVPALTPELGRARQTQSAGEHGDPCAA